MTANMFTWPFGSGAEVLELLRATPVDCPDDSADYCGHLKKRLHHLRMNSDDDLGSLESAFELAPWTKIKGQGLRRSYVLDGMQVVVLRHWHDQGHAWVSITFKPPV